VSLSLTVTYRNEVNRVKMETVGCIAAMVTHKLGSERARAESMKGQKKKVGDSTTEHFLGRIGEIVEFPNGLLL
jgi:hypothetical protein